MAAIPPPPRQVGEIEKDFAALSQYQSDLFEALGGGEAAPEVGRAPRGWIDGMLLSTNGTTLNVSAGLARSTDDEADINIAESITEKSWARFEAGSRNGMLDDGSVTGATWYHIFAIANPNDNIGDVLASLSVDEPTMPAGFTKFRRIGSVNTVSGGAIRTFVQFGDEFRWKDPPLDVNVAAVGTTAVLTTLSVPPGVNVKAIMNVWMDDAAQLNDLYLSPPDVNDEAPTIAAAPLVSFRRQLGVTADFGGEFSTWTNTARQIRRRASTASLDDLRIATLGWVDPRGRNL